MADEKGDPDKALEAWKRATDLDPANAGLAVKVATELAKRNEPAEAIRVLKDSIAAAPKEPETYIYLAQVYAKHLNKPELAIQMAQKAVEVAPDYFGALAALYEMHAQAGEKEKAAALIEKERKWAQATEVESRQKFWRWLIVAALIFVGASFILSLGALFKRRR